MKCWSCSVLKELTCGSEISWWGGSLQRMRLTLIEPRLFANFIWIDISILSEKGGSTFCYIFIRLSFSCDLWNHEAMTEAKQNVAVAPMPDTWCACFQMMCRLSKNSFVSCNRFRLSSLHFSVFVQCVIDIRGPKIKDALNCNLNAACNVTKNKMQWGANPLNSTLKLVPSIKRIE